MEKNTNAMARVARFCWLVMFFLLLTAGLMQADMPETAALPAIISDAYFKRQLDMQENTPQTMLSLGWGYYSAGRYDKAAEVLTLANQREPGLSAAYCLAMIDLKMGRCEEAVDKLTLIARRSPGHAGTRISLGRAYYRLRYFGQSAAQFRKAVEIDPSDQSSRVWLARSLINLNKPEQAADALAGVTHGPELAEAAALMKNLH